VVESTALEMRRTWKGTVGSNPTLSATLRPTGFGWQATDANGRRVSPEAPYERREAGAMWYVYLNE
jgi:hypothetical protein